MVDKIGIALKQQRIKEQVKLVYFQKGNLICISIWQQNTCKYTKADVLHTSHLLQCL